MAINIFISVGSKYFNEFLLSLHINKHNFLLLITYFHHEWKFFSPGLSPWLCLPHLQSFSTSLMTGPYANSSPVYITHSDLTLFSRSELHLSPYHNLFHLHWWQLHPSSGSAKTWTSPLTLLYQTSLPLCLEILLTRPSKYIPSQIPSLCLHCFQHHLNAHHLLPRLLS